MPITNVNQEPVNLQELLLVKSMPILSKMLGPKINGSNVNNYRVVDVEEINNETFVVIESTKDPLVDIDTATADQKVQRRIPYARHHIKNVFEHFFGAGPFPFVDIPDTLEKLNTWISEQGVDLVLDEEEVFFSAYQVTDTTGVVQIGPKDTKDLKWKGMYHMPIRRILEDDPSTTYLINYGSITGLSTLQAGESTPLTVVLPDNLHIPTEWPPEHVYPQVRSYYWEILTPATGFTISDTDRSLTGFTLIVDSGVAAGSYNLSIRHTLYIANSETGEENENYEKVVNVTVTVQAAEPLSVVWEWPSEEVTCIFTTTLIDAGEWVDGTIYFRPVGSEDEYESRSYQAANGGEFISGIAGVPGTQFDVYIELNTPEGPRTSEVFVITVPAYAPPTMNIVANQIINLESDDILEIVATLPERHAPLTEYQWSLDGNLPTGMSLTVTDWLHAELILYGVEPGTYNLSLFHKYNDFTMTTPIQVTVAGVPE